MKIIGRFILVLCILYSNGMIGQKPLVVSSASIFDDMVKNLGGTYITHESIVPIGSDPHTYEPTPSDVQLITEADIILINGLTFESWIDQIIDNSGTKAKVVVITKGIDPIASEAYHDAPDPHAWMDASNGIIYANNISQALIQYDPTHAESYQALLQKYVEQIKATDTYIADQIKRIPEDYRVLITSHDAFSYYGQRYGLQLQALMGISTEAEASVSDMMRVQEAVISTGIPAIFVESTINPKMLAQIAKDNNIVIGGELFADSVGDPGTPAGTYLGMLTHNTDTIVKALTDVVDRLSDDGKMPMSTLIAYLIIAMLMLVILVFMIMQMNKKYSI